MIGIDKVLSKYNAIIDFDGYGSGIDDDFSIDISINLEIYNKYEKDILRKQERIWTKEYHKIFMKSDKGKKINNKACNIYYHKNKEKNKTHICICCNSNPMLKQDYKNHCKTKKHIRNSKIN